MRKSYDDSFYNVVQDISRRTAEEIVPLVLQLTSPKRIIDVGCGLGTWLSVFKSHGIDDIWGIDGEWVDTSRLEIPHDRFTPCNLQEPLSINDRFDLVICLEVAEHLPASSAETLVDSLCALGPLVLFSAAIPFQGGCEHLNEQWPDYWAALFSRKDYVPIDCLRDLVWKNDRVEYYYAQNILLFAERGYLERSPLLKQKAETTSVAQLSVVHPGAYLYALQRSRSIREMAVVFPVAARTALVKRLRHLIGWRDKR